MIHISILKPDTVFQIAAALWCLGLHLLQIICDYGKAPADPDLFPSVEILELYNIPNGAILPVWSLKLWQYL